mmetsp:Transcript_18380/g.24259  ORF Transcript_18380/g.24259 Transcript_18380/m.24259 type:complete len:217 (-) Transcript_18380:340-990(-)
MMYRSVLVAAMAASASAFVPSFTGQRMAVAKSASSSALSMEFAGGLIGVATEVGEFDPLKLSEGKDEETLAWYRAAELKHGRVCMLAAVGYIVQGLYQLPDAPFSEGKAIDALIKVGTERPGALIQIGLAISAVEVLGNSIQKYNEPGDLGWDPLGIKPEDEEELNELKLKELKNGRLAMLSVAGMAAQEYVTGQGVIEQIASGHISPFGDGQGAF